MNVRLERTARAAAAGAALLALLALVSLASGRGRPRVAGSTDPAAVAEVRDFVLTIGITIYALGVLAIIWGLWRYRNDRDLGAGPRLGIGSILVLTAIASGLLWAFKHRPITPRPRQPELANLLPQAGKPSQAQLQAQRAQKPLPPVEFRWDAAAGVVAAMMAAVAAAVVMRRRLVDAELEPIAAREAAVAELAAVVESTLDDLRREADPRRAVIAAYAQLERVLARYGLPRRRSEAPFEYLGRMLGELRVRPASALALTELFERARFSEHVIDASMKDEAIDALIAVRDDLRAG